MSKSGNRQSFGLSMCSILLSSFISHFLQLLFLGSFGRTAVMAVMLLFLSTIVLLLTLSSAQTACTDYTDCTSCRYDSEESQGCFWCEVNSNSTDPSLTSHCTSTTLRRFGCATGYDTWLTDYTNGTCPGGRSSNSDEPTEPDLPEAVANFLYFLTGKSPPFCFSALYGPLKESECSTSSLIVACLDLVVRVVSPGSQSGSNGHTRMCVPYISGTRPHFFLPPACRLIDSNQHTKQKQNIVWLCVAEGIGYIIFQYYCKGGSITKTPDGCGKFLFGFLFFITLPLEPFIIPLSHLWV